MATVQDIINHEGTKTQFKRVNEIKDFGKFFTEAQKLSKEIENHNALPGQEHVIKNYIKDYKRPFGKSTQEDFNQLYSAVAKSFIEIAVAKCLSAGMKLEDLKNISIKLDNNKQMSYSLLDKNGKPITDPEKIIGELKSGKFDYDGSSNKLLDSKDGVAELFTARLLGYSHRPINNCNGQLLQKCFDLLGMMPAPHKVEEVKFDVVPERKTPVAVSKSPITISRAAPEIADEISVGKPSDPKFIPPGGRRGHGIIPAGDWLRRCLEKCLPLPGVTK